MKSKFYFGISLISLMFVSTLSFAAGNTAGAEEEWQIVEEGSSNAATAKPTTSTNRSASSNSSASSSQPQSKSNSQRSSSRSSGGNGGFKIGMGLDQGLSVVGQINNQVNFAIGNDGIAADYIFNRGRFGGDVPFTWFAGVGGQIKRSDNFGPRIALGVELDISNGWDAYAQLTPNMMFHKSDLKLGIGAGIGIRYSF
ncbi:hypothetical protein [Vibrio methylphosphonaticus]|uniref:hypothetical protein n=1 Tax=Vibrio methylphosphonaticus TaxID=2946866 RepID=UPI00202A03D8|nr:hypothetical protein [Vibrio methylphosphonaticus]MCL9774316.1 hypothetical protein [Vibrio methylphosphonaticus]